MGFPLESLSALAKVGIEFKPLPKKKSKRQCEPWEVNPHQRRRKRAEVTNSLIPQRLSRSIHAVMAAGFEMKVALFFIATIREFLCTWKFIHLR